MTRNIKRHKFSAILRRAYATLLRGANDTSFITFLSFASFVHVILSTHHYHHHYFTVRISVQESQKTDCLLVPTLSFTRLQMTKRDDDTPRVVRVLALHGSEGTGPDFVERIKPLVDALLTQHVELRLTQITAPFEKGNGYAWWTMPPGVRSFTATEYGGFETSASLVVDTIEKEGPFDLIFGHSQGAILISALLALQRLPTHPSVGYILERMTRLTHLKSARGSRTQWREPGSTFKYATTPVAIPSLSRIKQR